MTIYNETFTLYRDDPVEFIQTIMDDASRQRHYRCACCGTKVWPADAEALESFVTEHEASCVH